MNCPACGHTEHRVLRAVEGADGVVRRRRECASPSCRYRFWTIEALETVYSSVAAIKDAFGAMRKLIPGEE